MPLMFCRPSKRIRTLRVPNPILICTLLAVFANLSIPQAYAFASVNEPVVGIVSYQEYSHDQTSPTCNFAQDRVCLYTKYLDTVAHLASVKHFRYTIGTYAEVLAWMKQGEINIAMVTPGLASYVTGNEAMQSQWVVAAQEPDPPSSGAQTGGPYRSIALMARYTESYKKFDDVRGGLISGKLKAVFVDPLSESGFIKPCEVLGENCTKVAGKAEWTHDHGASRCGLLNDSGRMDQARVIFLSSSDIEGIDDLPCYKGLEGTRPIDLETNERPLQKGCLLVSTVNSEAVSALKSAMLATPLGPGLSWVPGDAASSYVLTPEVASAVKQLEWNSDGSYKVNLEAISKELARYKSTHGAQFKLAIIVSGAGSRGMYQAGVLESLMSCLFNAHSSGEANRPCSTVQHLDLSTQEFMIGSSAGAIHALIASYTCCNYDDRMPIQEEWKRLDPYVALVPFTVPMLCFGVGIALSAISIVFYFLEPKTGMLFGARVSTVVAIVGCGEILLLALVHILRLFLDVTWVVFVYAFLGRHWWIAPLVAAGVAILLSRRKTRLAVSSFYVLLGVSALGIVVQCFYEHALFDNGNVEKDLTSRIAAVSQDRTFRIPFYVMVTQLGAPKRTEATLNEDEKARTHFAFGSVDEESLLSSTTAAKIMTASSSVWPIFAPVEIDNKLYIDGSFSHSSAISLATRLGATHAIVIHGSSEEEIKDGRLVQNVGRAIGVLFEEAQREDQTARELVHLYEIFPDSELDYGFWSFGGSRMKASGVRGRRDAESQIPHYWQQLGPPRLEDPQ